MEDQISFDPAWSPVIETLIVTGSKEYALKDFEKATSNFSEACQVYSESHEGKDDPTLLFLYGRAMFQIGVSKSDVLGSTNNANGENGEPSSSSSKKQGTSQDDAKTEEEQNPNFQLANDVAEEEPEEGDEEAEEEQTEFELAWEALDAARAMFVYEIEKAQDIEDKTKKEAQIKNLETKLAETYDILGEVSLESENFPQASQDLSASLTLKQKIYASSSSLISEAHFKLSLAYEFCVEDPQSTEKAITEMVQAIASVKERLKESATEDVNLVKDLETRLSDLKKSKAETDQLNKQKSDALLGLIGEDSSIKQKLVDALGSQANDISSLVKKKKPAAGSATDKGKGKRKAVESSETDLAAPAAIASDTTESEPSKKQKLTE